MTKKRLFASVLALFLLLSCVALPTPAYAEGAEAPSNGLVLSKKAVANGDGTYTITMESYTTGTVTSITKTVPVDIVLVLDQSGSMAYDFNGKETNSNTARRQYAMKQAVNNFIASVADKYSAEADHRMAIVTFGSSASTRMGWTSVNEAGKSTLQGSINRLPDEPSGATNVSAGMEQAKTLMGSGYNYTGTNTPRQKVVIVFTDGVPTTSTDFNTGVADGAIASAKQLKDSGATVYSVGIFNGADPKQLYGEKWDYKVYKDIPCSGEIGSYWGGSIVSAIFGSNDFETVDIAAGNRFLNYLSSNVPGASSIGLERDYFDPGGHWVPGIGYKITANFTKSASSYYLTANDSTSLNGIFQEISDNIQTANIDLGSQTVVKDTVTKYFDLPANTSDIKVYTAAAKADGTFGEREVAKGVTPEIEGNAVKVTGFDFNANFVTDKLKDDNTYGKKLIVEFKVTPKAEFIGGNDVPTNDWENTGVYDKTGALVENFNDANTTPKVNVLIDPVTVKAVDKDVYLLGPVTAAQLQEGSTVKVGNVSLDLSASNYGLEAWQNEYVDITVEIKDEEGNVISSELSDLIDDTTYTVAVTVTPKPAGTNSVGEPATEQKGSKEAKINVYKPELTYKDSEVFYGDAVPTDFDTNNRIAPTKWKHDTTEADTSKMGAAPDLAITYTPEASKISDGKINSKDDIQVKATVKIDKTDVTGNTTFVHKACDPACGWNETVTLNGNPAFLLHVKTASLTIKKQGDVTANEGFIFKVACPDGNIITVSAPGGGEVTITGLPLGTYTVTEDTGWSWRYQTVSITNNGSVTLTDSDYTAEVTVTNTKTNKYLLDGNDYKQNNSALLSAGN